MSNTRIARPPSAITVRAWIAGILIAFLAAAAWTSLHKGIWYDEVWSVFEVRHDLPLGRIIIERWLRDIHPPAFYALSWLTEPLTGDGIFARRALNLAPMAFAGAMLAGIGRKRADARGFLAVFAMLLLGAGPALTAIVDHRSNFSQLAACAALAGVLYAIVTSGRDYARADRWLLGLAGLSALAAFNFHYLGAFDSAALLGVFIVALALCGQRGWALRLAIVGAVAALPVAASFAVQHVVLADTARNFWAATTGWEALAAYGSFLGAVLLANLVASGVALLRAVRPGDDAERRFAWIAAVAVIVALVALFALNAARPVIQPRYLLAILPFALAALAALASGPVMRDRRLFAGVAATALAMIGLNGWISRGAPNWDATAAFVGGEQRDCPDTAIHARPHWTMAGGQAFLLDNEAAVDRAGYELEARRFATRLEPEGGARVSARCPTLVWVTHAAPPPASGVLAVRAGLKLSPKSIGAARIFVGGSGYVAVFPPLI
ncbi:MAG: hypothetical protein H0X36_09210 [Sphingomonadaceae bacterium]|nr:hypothetical protein [Sphingomonadaceae bacterium]